MYLYIIHKYVCIFNIYVCIYIQEAIDYQVAMEHISRFMCEQWWRGGGRSAPLYVTPESESRKGGRWWRSM